MGYSKFSSPREEALKIAYETRNSILKGTSDAISTLRACSAIAVNLNKEDDEKWLNKELFGYSNEDKIPSYRIVASKYTTYGVLSNKYTTIPVQLKASLILSYIKTKGLVLRVSYRDFVVNVPNLEAILEGITDRCCSFLNEVIAELQYGGIVENLMEEIRKETDVKLNKINSKAADETQSLCANLTSTNPADWNKVGHSCRKLLKMVADSVFPPRDEKYIAKNGDKLEIGDPNYINRLIAFLDQNISCEERKLVSAEIAYLESYLRQIVDRAQKAEHAPLIEKYHAQILAVHTYLILSEIMKHVS
ncbi:hypothetical protein MUO79_09540 [Candidatus Bathyarchaeota archaeon]|nr:hypothetical protein [Candidatus Bathyarchaeota archaeon]